MITPLEQAARFAGCSPHKMRNFLRYLADHSPRLNIWRKGFARLYYAAKRCALATILDDRFVPTLWGNRWTLLPADLSAFDGYSLPTKAYRRTGARRHRSLWKERSL